MNKRSLLVLSLVLLFVGLVLFFHSNKAKIAPQEKTQTSPNVTVIEATPSPKTSSEPLPTMAPALEKKKITIIGQLPSSGLKGLRYLNSSSKEGIELYKNNVLRFQSSNNKIKIIQEESLLEILPQKTARYLEKIIVVTTHDDGQEDSFTALIDSQSGEVIKTFNQVKRDDIPNSYERPSGMVPTGVIEKK